ncbi:SDR family NAD(P)-dependent oxidoreductase [Paractinoplanes rhizophilus]|uniref:SDR family NAD(P)-dependent oxidoreductase n=1 Tax=Paractinoplanes rhizophilus TaxID=1416877 RepID=A0ABW2HQZ8_9ACTN
MEFIAVIGTAVRFPQAMDVGEYWDNLVAGRDCCTELEDDDLLRRGESPDYLANPGYVRRRPIMPEPDMFDHRCFGLTPKEVELRDPGQRVFLELCHSAIEQAGYDPARYPGAIGVFGGTNDQRYRVDHLEPIPDIMQTVGFLSIEIANHPDYVGTFVAHRLGLRGPALTVHTACSSTLTAVHTACRSLQTRDCDMALAGVASIQFPIAYGYIHQEGSIVSSDGVVRPFDADADGTNFGSGAGVVLLKRLDDALADRDKVLAVIRGTALNNDGDRKAGFTTPSPVGQAECIAAALRSSGVHPRDISYVEAHGTGTSVGDPIEVAGLVDAFQRVAGEPLPAQYCGLGSVKGNVGHMAQAAGASGLIKTVLALQHEVLPASINLRKLNPKLQLEKTPFTVLTETTPWPRVADRPRRAGVSSFGIGGTNGHVILEEAPATDRTPLVADRSCELLVWSAAEEKALDAYADRLADHLENVDDRAFHDSAYTLRVGRTQRRHRRALVAGDAGSAVTALRSGNAGIRADGTRRSPVFCFPGQGAQHPGMAHQLYREEPVFQRYCDESFEILEPLLGFDLRRAWLTAEDPEVMAETRLAQPLIYLLECAMAHLLADWGLTPDRVLGHSVGEIAAATVAGVFSREDGLRVISERARLMQEMPRGRMLAVAAGRAAVEPYLNEDVSLAAVNGRAQTIVSGPEEAIEDVAQRLRSDRIASSRLGSSHAFHSPMMAPAAAAFEAMLKDVTLSPPALPLVSVATGQELTGEQAQEPGFWARQLVDPVLFAPALHTLLKAGPAFLLEVGPGHTLSALMRGDAEVRSSGSVALPTSPATVPDKRGRHDLEETLGRLWVEGLPVDLARRDAGRGLHRIQMPGYAYQRRRFWVERAVTHSPARDNALPVAPAETAAPTSTEDTAPVAEPAAVSPAESAPGVPVPGAPASEWSLAAWDWTRRLEGTAPVPAARIGGQDALLVLPGGLPDAAAFRRAFQRAGYRTRIATAPERPATGPAPTGGRVLAPGSEEDWTRILSDLAPDAPLLIAHALLAGGPAEVSSANLDEQLERGYHDLVACARAVARSRGRDETILLVLARNAVDVTGAETVNPATAMVHGLLRSLEQEYANLRCVLVDVGAGTRAEMLTDTIATLDLPLVALRGSARWEPGLRPVPRTSLPGRPRLRVNGTYLITGGLGGIGLVTAQALADTGLEPRLVLMGRSASPATDSLQGAQLAAAIEELEEAGAEVLVVRGDVTDRDSLKSVLAQVRDRFGALHGVVHSAGVAGGGLVRQRSREDVMKVLAPKLHGTVLIEECLAGQPLDFLLLFSSIASLTGMLGSADYAAANAFLNAWAQQNGRGDCWTTSVAWPGWSEVGMLAQAAAGVAELLTGGSAAAARPAAPATGDGRGEPPADTQEALEFRRTLSPETDWELTEHRFSGRSALPGTASMELIVTAARELGLVPADRAVEVRDAVLAAPVNAPEPIELRVAFTPMADVHRFRLQSRPAGTERPWQHHVNGVVAAGPADVPQDADVAAIRAGLAEAPPARLPSPQSGWLEFGPRWDCVTRLEVGPRECLAELVVPEEYQADLKEHLLHPAVLDRAGMIIPAGDEDRADGPRAEGAEPQARHYIPFLYRRLRFFAPIPARVLAHGRMSPDKNGVRLVDIDLYEPDTGRLLVQVTGYTVREVDADDFMRRLAEKPKVAAPSVQTLEQMRSAAAGPVGNAPLRESRPVEVDDNLLRPREGAQALLDILDGRYPSFLLVLPKAGGAVPGMPWSGAAVAPRPTEPAPKPVTVAAVTAPPTPPPAPATTGTESSAPAAVPDSMETIVAAVRELWTEALGIDEIGLDEDFFELGGNSLVAVQLSARLRERFGVELSAGALFDANTIERLAKELLATKAG